jgi:galactokinase
VSAALPAGFFDPGSPITQAHAPGRLDVLGGVADYSGSVVLEMPLVRTTLCAAQPRPDDHVRIRSDCLADEELSLHWEGDLRILLVGANESYEDVRRRLRAEPVASWVGYIAGVLTVLHTEGYLTRPSGFNLYLRSDVPLGAGVSSSASVEVATMKAVRGALALNLDDLELARLCQQVENRVVGAPCGIMDQVTCALGQANRLIAIRCRPCEVLGHLDIPQGAAFIGIHSGIKHTVGGSRYTLARVAAFMGLKLIRQTETGGGLECLCDLEPDTLRRLYYSSLPAHVTGGQFLREHGETGDAVTRVDPHERYSVRGAVEHAVYENTRVLRFMQLLRKNAPNARHLAQAGRLMYASHWSYGHRIGLGASETDLLVRLAREAGPATGIYGAKITGGGSGGTVALLTGRDAMPTLERIAAEYQRRTGLKAHLLEGSAPGMSSP